MLSGIEADGVIGTVQTVDQQCIGGGGTSHLAHSAGCLIPTCHPYHGNQGGI